jgi:O-antigen/teichoic acid export membrane protein
MGINDPMRDGNQAAGASHAKVNSPSMLESQGDTGPARDDHQRHLATDHLLVNLKGRVVSSGFVTILAQGVKFALTLASTMALARLLLPEDFGLVAMVTTIIGFLRVFKDAGLSTATVQREGITHAQVSNLFWINAGLSCAAGLVVVVSAPAVVWFYREPRLFAITLTLSVTFLLTGLTVQHMALLNRQMRFKAIAAIEIGSMLAGSSVGIGMAWLKGGYWSLVWSQLTMSVVGFLLTWLFSGWRPQRPTRNSGIRPLLGFGVNLSASSFLYSLTSGADSLLIGRFYGPGPVGLYSRAGAMIRRPLEQFLSPISSVFLPALSRVQAQPERYRRTFLQAYEVIALPGFFFTGLFLALARPLTLVLLGPKWEQAAAIFGWLTLGMLYAPLATTSSWLFESQGRGRDALRTSLFLSSVTLCSFVVGLPFGPTGVARAASISCVLILLPFVFHMAGRSGPVCTADLWRGFFRHLPVAVIVFVATYSAHALAMNFGPLIQLLICAPVGLLVGVAFISIYAPSRRTALTLLDTLREFTKRRAKTAA